MKKKIKQVFFVSIIIVSSVFSQNNKTCSHWIEAYDKLTPQQYQKLELCLKFLLDETEMGYVLFGNKPVYFGGYDDILDHYHNICSRNTKDFFFTRFFAELFEKLDLLMDIENDYIIQVQHKNSVQKAKDDFNYVIIVNKKAFLETVSRNLLLFQYILGPKVTAEGLLKKIVDSNETIFSALNNDVTLVGIVLGYGGYNSCTEAYDCRIQKYLEPNHENIPLISRKEICEKRWDSRKNHLHAYNKKSRKSDVFPSFGYNSLKEELSDLRKKSVLSFTLSEENHPKLLHFGCVKNDETNTILETYKNDQKRIQEILRSDKIVEYFFARFAKIDKIDVSKPNNQRKIADSNDYSDLLSQMFITAFQKYLNGNENFIRGFIEGLKSSDEKEFPSVFLLQEREIKDKIKAKENLKYADEYFEKIKNQKTLVSLVPNKLYFSIISEGSGPSLKSMHSKVSLFYKFYRLDDKDFNIRTPYGVVKNEHLVNLIPGIGKALIGMKKNERKKIFIHPAYAYGENTTFEPNLGLIVEIELINFEENQSSEKEKEIKPHELHAFDYEIGQLNNELEKGFHKMGQSLGSLNAAIIKKNTLNFSLDKIVENLDKFLINSSNLLDINNINIKQKINDIYWLIYLSMR